MVTSGLLALNAANANFTLATGRQIEVGVKQSLFDGRAEWILAGYEIVKRDHFLERTGAVPDSGRAGPSSGPGRGARLIQPLDATKKSQLPYRDFFPATVAVFRGFDSRPAAFDAQTSSHGSLSSADRVAHRVELHALLQTILQEKDSKELSEQLLKKGILTRAILDVSEALSAPHTAYRSMIVEDGDYIALGIPIKMSRTPGSVRSKPKIIGSDTRSTLRTAGLAETKFDRLVSAGVAFETVKSKAKVSREAFHPTFAEGATTWFAQFLQSSFGFTWDSGVEQMVKAFHMASFLIGRGLGQRLFISSFYRLRNRTFLRRCRLPLSSRTCDRSWRHRRQIFGEHCRVKRRYIAVGYPEPGFILPEQRDAPIPADS